MNPMTEKASSTDSHLIHALTHIMKGEESKQNMDELSPTVDTQQLLRAFYACLTGLDIQRPRIMQLTLSDTDEYAQGNAKVYKYTNSGCDSDSFLLKEFELDLDWAKPKEALFYLGHILREIDIGVKLRGVKGTLPIIGICYSKDAVPYGIVRYGGQTMLDYMQYLPPGYKARSRPFARRLYKVFIQMVRIVSELHSFCGIAHRDLKPSNIVVNDSGVVHVIDFGASRRVDNLNESHFQGLDIETDTINDLYTNPVTTCTYAGPELLTAGDGFQFYDPFKSDVWSIGMIFLSLVRCWVTPNIIRVSYLDASDYKQAFQDLQRKWFMDDHPRRQMISFAYEFLGQVYTSSTSWDVSSKDGRVEIEVLWTHIRECLNRRPEDRPGLREVLDACASLNH